MAFVTAGFMMTFLGQGSYAECSVASLNPVTRWLMYYFAVKVREPQCLQGFGEWYPHEELNLYQRFRKPLNKTAMQLLAV